MNLLEKTFTVFALLFAIGLLLAILFIPALQKPDALIPACLAGFAVNVGLLFIVFKDIFLRQFNGSTTKYIWLALVLFIWPSIPFYLVKYGFKPRQTIIPGSTRESV